jgi:hypothetical protein
VTPNLSGVYGPSIACTIKTIRSSPNTGKVSEGIDFFTQKTIEAHSSQQQSQETEVEAMGLIHVSTNHFNGIEMTSTAITSAAASGASCEDTEKALSKLSLGARSVEGDTAEAAAGAASERSGGGADVGVQSVKPTFAILNQHEGEEEDDLDDDPDADLDL